MPDAEAFDWRAETTRKGTVSRVGQFVRGDCACGAEDVLVYDSYDDDTLMCADCSRKRSLANPRVEVCDDCGESPAWRDPIAEGGKVFRCARCHGEAGTYLPNRWAPKSRMLNNTGVPRAQCEMRGITDCRGEIKYRSALRMQACNKHAGKESSGPEHHQ